MEVGCKSSSKNYQLCCQIKPSRNESVSPPVPVKFNFGFTKQHPLIPLAAAALFLNHSRREVLTLIENGKLRWAFDIRSPRASRREVRILRQSLFEFAGLYSFNNKASSREIEFQRVMDLILPEEFIQSPADVLWKTTRPSLRRSRNFQNEMRLAAEAYRIMKVPRDAVMRGTEIAEYFSCIPQHVTNLIRKKMFQTVNVPRGPKASPFVTRASVIQFLKKRRMS
jgi:hypothetical protein